MSLTRFQTNRKLWLLFSCALFFVPWFIPLIQAGKGEEIAASYFATAIFSSDRPIYFLGITVLFACAFAFAAAAVGWALQCVVVVLKKPKESSRNAA